VNDNERPGSGALGREVECRLEVVCRQFEAAWIAGIPALIESFLHGWSESERLVLLRELVLLDVHYRTQRGEVVTVGDYAARFPECIPQWFPADTSAVRTALDSTAEEGRTVLESTVRADQTALPEVPGYEVRGELGRGGMGIVYQAWYQALKRMVALKMIRSSGHPGERERARFQAEVEAVARLQHPNIVQVFEVNLNAGPSFCALEFVEGGNLSKKIAGKPQPAREAARLVRTLAEAMQLAHSRNVVHRDLKPANVLLTTDGVSKVSDFGLAKQLDGDSGQTQNGAVIGTPSCMAPEQANGLTNAVGPAADIYALGAILYECLTGQPSQPARRDRSLSPS
jgi:eukaryotic-like serine/threonine-protein kinase